MAYLPQWSNLPLQQLPLERVDVLNLAFASIDSQGLLSDPHGPAKWRELEEIRRRYPHLKILISVGGWTGSQRFSEVALSPASRAKFAQSLTQFVHAHRLDGADIDWEYPVSGGLAQNHSRPQDKHNFSLLLQEIRRRLPAPKLLTTALCAERLDQVEPAQIATWVDWIGVMTYDMQKEKETSHHSALYPDTNRSIRAYRRAGVPASKLMLGVPAYGHSWRGSFPNSAQLGQSATPGRSYTYREIQSLQSSAGWVRHWDAASQAAWLVSNRHDECISYEDRAALQAKVRYAGEQHLGGYILWEITGDSTDPSTSLIRVLRP